MKYILILIALSYSMTVSSQQIYKYNDSHKIGTGKTLHLSSNDANVIISGNNTSNASIEIYREAKGSIAKKEDFGFEIEEKNGDLFILERRKQSKVNFIGYLNIMEYTINISLPHNVKLKLEGDDDNYEIKNIDGEIIIKSEDGNVNIFECNSPKINIKSDDGNINIANFNGDFKTSLEDGNITMTDCVINNFDVKIDDGNINLKYCETRDTKIRTEDGNINLDVVKGDLSVTLDDGDFVAHDVYSQNIDIKGYDGDVSLGLHMENNANYKIELDDGDLDIELLSGGGIIKVRCDDGDVKLRSRDFDMLTDEDHYKEIKTSGSGNGKMVVKIEDGNVRIGK